MSGSGSGIDLPALDRLQADYCLALDRQDMSQWLALFADDTAASYICTTAENAEAGLPLALMLDDCRARLEDRVTYITRVWAGTFQKYRTRHLTQRLRAEAGQNGTVALLSAVVVYYTAEEEGISRVLATGVYEDIVVIDGPQPRFLAKKVVLDTSVMPRYLVYPL